MDFNIKYEQEEDLFSIFMLARNPSLNPVEIQTT